MLRKAREKRPSYIYPADPWRMVEKRFYPKFMPATETIFAVANGYLGIRGTFDEGRPVADAGTLVNGFYESWPIVYGEEAFGFARTGQTIVNVTDATIIKLYVDDEPFYLPTAQLVRFERCLDMQRGTLDREVVWETPSGKHVAIRSRRLVSFPHRHVAAIWYEVMLQNADAPVVITSEMIVPRPGDVPDPAATTDPRTARSHIGHALGGKIDYGRNERIVLAHATRRSGMTLACGVDHLIETECTYSVNTRHSPDAGQVVVTVEGRAGAPIQLTKFMVYHTSRNQPPEELCERSERTLDRAVGEGFTRLLQGQRAFLDDFWYRSDIEIGGDPVLQQAARFNLFQICQATARAEGAGIPAKGLTGDGYEGHYFWDAEIYVLPFLIYTAPRIARNLLTFRHSYLEKARERAREVNQEGALFPWRTINGEEASAYYAAGTAQYHINADIMYALKKYVDVTGDEEFLFHAGAEMLIETARLWVDLGFYSMRRGDKFCIDGVTGPDEYNTVVNNNTFTNLMARENLWYAADTLDAVREKRPDRFAALVHETGLVDSEIQGWRNAADRMYVPFSEELGIHPQDDQFLDRKPWDFETTPDDNYPLLLHYHPLVIYRHQVIKQADVVLAMFLLGNEFSDDQKKRNFDYYDPLTTGDSSLSASIQGIMASEVGNVEKAREYIRYAAFMDLSDVAGNVKDGCHIASMGGTWMAVVYGLAGMRDYDGQLTFRPRLPERMESLRFPLLIRGRRLEVSIARDGVTYVLRGGEGLTIRHYEEDIQLSPDSPVTAGFKMSADPSTGESPR